MPSSPTAEGTSSSSGTSRLKRSSSSASSSASKKSKSNSKITNFLSKEKGKKKTESSPVVIYNDSDNSNTTINNSSPLAKMKPFPGPDLNIRRSGSPNGKIPIKSNIKKVHVRNITPSSASKKKEYFEESKRELRNAVVAVLEDQTTVMHAEPLYRIVENLCRDHKAAALWEDCLGELKRHIEAKSGETKKVCSSMIDNESALKTVIEQWRSWEFKIQFIRRIYFYLDRDYLFNKGSRQPIWETGVALFSDNIINDRLVLEKIKGGVVALLNNLRLGNYDKVVLVKDVARVLKCCRKDLKMLRQLVIDSAFEFPKGLHLSPKQTKQYLDAIESQANTEDDLCRSVLDMDESLAETAQLRVKESMVNDCSHELFSGVSGLVFEGDIMKLRLMYSIAKSISKSDELREEYGKFVKDQIELILSKDVKRAIQIIPDLLTFFKLSDRVVSNGFSGHTSGEDFRYTWRHRVEEALQQRAYYVAEGLAKHVDHLLRSGDDLQQQLDSVVELLNYVSAKDVFQKHYERDFAKRLLQNKSQGIDYETLFISLLKKKFGGAFTEKAEVMIKDMKTSQDEMIKYKEQMNTKVQFNASMLSEGKWPTFPSVKVEMPDEMTALINRFEELYKDVHHNVKVTWQHSLGSCTIKAHFDNGTKELLVNQLQAVIIMLFNDRDSLTYENISNELGVALNDKDGSMLLKQALVSLSCGKVKILTKEPHSLTVEPLHKFTIAKTLAVKAHKIKIATLQLPSNEQERRQQVEQEVERDRSMEIQAAIVRIMKSRKKLEHFELVQQVISLIQHRGQVPVPQIKKGIEDLLGKEHILRAEESSDTYIYNT